MSISAPLDLNSYTPIEGAQHSAGAFERGKDRPDDLSIPQLIERHAVLSPHRKALVGNVELTYSELDKEANRLANYLQVLGLAPEARVGLCMQRSPLNVMAALAVLKAGGAYLPMDPTYPRDRLAFISEDANIAILLTEAQVAETLPAGNWRPVVLDRDARAIANCAMSTPPRAATLEQLAYLIYTSGSTGTPKGVQITHSSLLNLVRWHQRAFAITSEDRATQLASFGFDAAVWEIWPYLTTGSSIYITPDTVRNSPELLRDWLVAQQVTISFVPTPLAERLITLEWPADTKLRILLTGADTLHHYPRPGLPFQLINNYGPTEATVVATSGLVPPLPASQVRPPIGRPIDNIQIHVCDDSLHLVPPGEVGEMYIGGAGVARGYVNSPELTAQRFVPDPYSKQPGARLYRTGDLARFLPDGQLTYLGRIDDLIKIRGYRVEPNEIVSVLNTHPAVQASTVVARPDGTGNLRLLAYLVANNGTQPMSSSLRALLRERLPDYMVPAVFIGMDSLPLTPNGKVDREALPAPDAINTLPDEDYTAPRSAFEERLSAIVASLLGLERVGMNDNFFLIGGHSLFGTQLIARIQEHFGVELPLLSVFDLPTPALLAKEIERLIVAKVNAMDESEVESALQQAGSGVKQL